MTSVSKQKSGAADKSARKQRVLAIDPFSSGVGFVVFEGPHNLIDWGLKTTRRTDNGKSVRAIKDLLARFRPDVLARSIRRHRRTPGTISSQDLPGRHRHADPRGEFVAHFHGRNHQGKSNALLFPSPALLEPDRPRGICCRERLGGLLRYYSRAA